MTGNAIYLVTVWAIPVIIAITFHEATHGFVAHLLGDFLSQLITIAAGAIIEAIVHVTGNS